MVIEAWCCLIDGRCVFAILSFWRCGDEVVGGLKSDGNENVEVESGRICAVPEVSPGTMPSTKAHGTWWTEESGAQSSRREYPFKVTSLPSRRFMFSENAIAHLPTYDHLGD